MTDCRRCLELSKALEDRMTRWDLDDDVRTDAMVEAAASGRPVGPFASQLLRRALAEFHARRVGITRGGDPEHRLLQLRPRKTPQAPGAAPRGGKRTRR